jgi:hypothetical protein
MVRGEQAELFINGQRVGSIRVESSEGSWSFGHFEPEDGFAPFAPLFGAWSLIINEDPNQKLDEAASTALREAESQIDRLDCRLYITRTHAWVRLEQLNIDGHSADWKTP